MTEEQSVFSSAAELSWLMLLSLKGRRVGTAEYERMGRCLEAVGEDRADFGPERSALIG